MRLKALLELSHQRRQLGQRRALEKEHGETARTLGRWFSAELPDLSQVTWPTFEAGAKVGHRIRAD